MCHYFTLLQCATTSLHLPVIKSTSLQQFGDPWFSNTFFSKTYETLSYYFFNADHTIMSCQVVSSCCCYSWTMLYGQLTRSEGQWVTVSNYWVIEQNIAASTPQNLVTLHASPQFTASCQCNCLLAHHHWHHLHIVNHQALHHLAQIVFSWFVVKLNIS